MWERWRREIGSKRRELAAFIGEGVEIDGKYRFTGVVMLEGKISGEIAASETLVIGDRGQVTANIRGAAIIIRGELIGNVLATERIELRPTARVTGNLEAPVVVVSEGVQFEGHCRINRAQAPPEGAAIIALPRQ